MSLLILLFGGIGLLLLGYFFYGFALSRWLALRQDAPTPACELRDDIDFCPTNRWYLVGQHLSAIAAAGPIVGPLLAAMWFGWLPTVLWIILGGIFIGAVHDMASLVASMRHKGRSIAEVIKAHMNRRAYILFLLFIWFSLVYIIAAFTDITASTFVEQAHGAAVASSSMLYLMLALGMGIVMRTTKLPLAGATTVFLPLVFVCISAGARFPFTLPVIPGLDARTTWDIVLLTYCFIASVIPVWLLLQPRGYLGGFFLTATAGIAFIGIIVSSLTRQLLVTFPAFLGWTSSSGLPLFPILFTTVACGAVSGFHSIVAAGTTSKQVAKETDARLIGFGGMLMESFVALIALSTLLILTTSQAQQLGDPSQVYANGIAVFLSSMGISREFALNFALLAFATFVYDTLDVATRLGRYIFQELTGSKGRLAPFIATAFTLVLPLIFLMQKFTDANGTAIPAWKIFWTIFGSSNQLMAAMTLIGLSVWLFKKRARFIYMLLPALFMTVVAVISILFVLRGWFATVLSTGKLVFSPMALTGCVLLLLAFFLISESIAVFFRSNAPLKRLR